MIYYRSYYLSTVYFKKDQLFTNTDEPIVFTRRSAESPLHTQERTPGLRAKQQAKLLNCRLLSEHYVSWPPVLTCYLGG